MNLKFELSLEEANLIVGALMKLPMETVEKLVSKLRAQAQPQLEEEAEAPKKEKK